MTLILSTKTNLALVGANSNENVVMPYVYQISMTKFQQKLKVVSATFLLVCC